MLYVLIIVIGLEMLFIFLKKLLNGKYRLVEAILKENCIWN